MARCSSTTDRKDNAILSGVEVLLNVPTSTPTPTTTPSPTPSATPSPTATPTTPAAGEALERINAGGPQITVNGATFAADKLFVGGKAASSISGVDIANTSSDALYYTARTGISGANQNGFSYQIPVPAAGSYTVRLHFAEIYFTGQVGKGPAGAGQRVFSVNLEGGAVELANYDIKGVFAGPPID